MMQKEAAGSGRRTLRAIARAQRGMTMVELVMAMGVTVVIMGAVTFSVAQIWSMNRASSGHMTATRQVQNAGYWVSRDSQMAQAVSVSSPGKFLVLQWADFQNRRHIVEYTLADNPDGLKTMYRRYDAEYDGAINDGEATPVGYSIDPTGTSVAYTSGKIAFQVTARPSGGAGETRTYEVKPRPGS